MVIGGLIDATTVTSIPQVHLMSWNPRMDLLALVSDKGEVCLKRPGWKTTWKVRTSEEFTCKTCSQ